MPEHDALPAIEETQPRFITVPVQEPRGDPSIKATIATVETAAAAKIFFETLYDGFMSNAATPRELRRAALDQKLAELDIADDEKAYVRRQ